MQDYYTSCLLTQEHTLTSLEVMSSILAMQFITVLIINVLVRGSVMSDLVLMLPFLTFSANDVGWPTLNKSNTSVKAPDWKESGTDTTSKTASPAGTPGDKVRLT